MKFESRFRSPALVPLAPDNGDHPPFVFAYPHVIYHYHIVNEDFFESISANNTELVEESLNNALIVAFTKTRLIGASQADLASQADQLLAAMQGKIMTGLVNGCGIEIDTLEFPPDSEAAAPAPAPKEPTLFSEWVCSCGTASRGRFCPECGTARPRRYRCHTCGWVPPDPERPSRFCPDCGNRFSDDDLAW